MITIRLYREDDGPFCRTILYDTQTHDFTWIDPSKVDVYDFDRITEGEQVFVLCDKDVVVAFAAVWEADYFIHSLTIDSNYRRLGYGKQLIYFLLDYYNHPLTLKCVKTNSQALSFYQSLSWVILKEEIGPDGPYYLIGSKSS